MMAEGVVGVKCNPQDFGGFAEGEGGLIDVYVGCIVGLVGVRREQCGGAFGSG